MDRKHSSTGDEKFHESPRRKKLPRLNPVQTERNTGEYFFEVSNYDRDAKTTRKDDLDRLHS